MGINKSDDRRYKLTAEKHHVRTTKEEPLSPSEINYSLQEPLVSTIKCDSRLDDELLTIQNEVQYGSESLLVGPPLGLGSPVDSSGIIDVDKTNDSTILFPYSHFSKPMSGVAAFDTILSWDLEPRPIEEMMRGCC
jgi:hypothetical protein